MNSLDSLKRGRERVLNNWTQGNLVSFAFVNGEPVMCYCTIGAVCDVKRLFSGDLAKPSSFLKFQESVLPDEGAVEELLGCLNAGLTERDDEYEYDLDDWNDDPARTLEEVVDLFDTAIECLEASLA